MNLDWIAYLKMTASRDIKGTRPFSMDNFFSSKLYSDI